MVLVSVLASLHGRSLSEHGRRSRPVVGSAQRTQGDRAMAQDVDEFEFFLDKPWSDGLPVVTPTEARVQRMLEGTHCAPDEVVGHIPPMLEPATVRTVAIHALMAGCKPDYLPVVLGGLRIMLREEFNLNGVQGTMHGVAPLMIVSGPYAQHIGLHGGNANLAIITVTPVRK